MGRLVGGVPFSNEIIAKALAAGALPVEAEDTRTRQEKRKDARQKAKKNGRSPRSKI